jgi:hypothetical protein
MFFANSAFLCGASGLCKSVILPRTKDIPLALLERAMELRPSLSFDVIGIVGIILTIVFIVLDKAGKLKGGLLIGLLCFAGVMTLFLAIGNSFVLDAPVKWKLWRGLLMFSLVAFIYSGMAIWISSEGAPPESSTKGGDQQEGQKGPVNPPKPSLVFIFGAPLGDNDSAQWVMVLKHYGPSLAYNCNIGFYDDDRKNIEHEWLVKNPNSPYPPSGLAGESQKRFHLVEAGPEGDIGSFKWNPLNPNSQHYTVTIDCRDGVFTEKWEIARIDGVLRSRITIEHGPQWIKNNPSLEPVIFRYQDPEFVTTALATEVPKPTTAKVVHPGWKPSHRFEVPAAIIDPNGNVQVLSGVKAPDGSTITDFGSWNILTKHYGD